MGQGLLFKRPILMTWMLGETWLDRPDLDATFSSSNSLRTGLVCMDLAMMRRSLVATMLSAEVSMLVPLEEVSPCTSLTTRGFASNIFGQNLSPHFSKEKIYMKSEAGRAPDETHQLVGALR